MVHTLLVHNTVVQYFTDLCKDGTRSCTKEPKVCYETFVNTRVHLQYATCLEALQKGVFPIFNQLI